MTEDFRPRWVGPASIAFSLFVLFVVGGGLGLLLYNTFRATGPDADTVFFADTLPRWWIARAKDEPPRVDALAHLPRSELKPVLESIDGLFGGDPKAVAVESATLNQALEEAKLPFWVDVVVRGRFPVVMTYAVHTRDRWRVGEAETDVLHVSRLDRTNVVTAFTGKKGYDLPVVLLAEIEGNILTQLRDEARHPVAKTRQSWLSKSLETQGSSLELAARAVAARDRHILRMERRMKGGSLRVTRPERFELPYAWYAWLRRYSDHGTEGTFFFSNDIDEVEAADKALSEGPLGAALLAYRNQLAAIGAAHEAHLTLAPDPETTPPPAELVAYYGEEDTAFRRGGHLHMLGALGAARDAEAPVCASLVRMLGGAAGRYARATAWHYGTMAALHAWFGTTETDPGALAQAVEAACTRPDAELRARARTVAGRVGLPPGEKLQTKAQ